MSKLSTKIETLRTSGIDDATFISELERIIDRQQSRIEKLTELKKQVPFDVAFDTLVAQLRSVIDGTEDGFVANDAGKELPSRKDMGLRIVLSMLTQTVHNQLAGTAKNKGAQTYLDMYRSQRDLPETRDRLSRMQPTPDDLKLLRQLEVQAARCQFLAIMRDTFQHAFEQTTGEAWKPYEAPVNAVGEKAKPFTAADFDRLLKM